MNDCFCRLQVLIVACGIGFSVNLSVAETDAEYIEKQDAEISKCILDYFNADKGYYDVQRKMALYLVDSLCHDPVPHSDVVKDLFLQGYQKACHEIPLSKTQNGVRIWSLYNMAYVVQSRDLTLAFDLTMLPECLRQEEKKALYDQLAVQLVQECDILFVSHFHGDHADKFIAEQFIKGGKKVIAPDNVFAKESFCNDVQHLSRNGREQAIDMNGSSLSVRIYPGHQDIKQGVSTVINNFVFVTLPNGITIAHSGDQCSESDLSWIDTIHKDIDTDILLVNYWTKDSERLTCGIKPNVVLPGHINEMMHQIHQRGPYWQSMGKWRNVNSTVLHLFWGESCEYNKTLSSFQVKVK